MTSHRSLSAIYESPFKQFLRIGQVKRHRLLQSTYSSWARKKIKEETEALRFIGPRLYHDITCMLNSSQFSSISFIFSSIFSRPRLDKPARPIITPDCTYLSNQICIRIQIVERKACSAFVNKLDSLPLQVHQLRPQLLVRLQLLSREGAQLTP